MTNKPTTPHVTKKRADVANPGMMGDGTEEQNLNQPGDPAARIRRKTWKPPSPSSALQNSLAY
jgi:hypothetical protein